MKPPALARAECTRAPNDPVRTATSRARERRGRAFRTAMITTTPIVVLGLRRAISSRCARDRPQRRATRRPGVPARPRAAGPCRRVALHQRLERDPRDRARTAESLEILRDAEPGDRPQRLDRRRRRRERVRRRPHDALEPRFLLPASPSGSPARCRASRRCTSCVNGTPYPRPPSVFPGSEDDVREYVAGALVSDRAEVHQRRRCPAAAPSVLIARDREELTRGYRRWRRPDVGNVMLQEYIPGTPETVWMFNGYFDEASTCKIGFTGRKIRQSPPYTGATTLGECLANPTVHGTRPCASCASSGIAASSISAIASTRATASTSCSTSIPHRRDLPAVRGRQRDGCAAGAVPRSHRSGSGGATAPPGRRWVVELLDVMSTIVYRRRGDLTLGRWFRSFRGGVREAAWFARDDLRPFLTLWFPLVRDRLSQRLRRR